MTSAPTPARSPVPFGLVGMAVLVVAVELAIGGRHMDFTTIAADDWRRTGEAASARVRGRDVLCFGDSLIKFGVLPRVIESKAGLKTYNLAINAGPMPAQYFLFKRAIEAGARPKAVVADFFALMLPDQPRESVRAYPEFASLSDCVDLARTAGDTDLLTLLVLGKTLPSVRCRFEIRNSIGAALQGFRASPWPVSRKIWATWKDQLGAQPMPKLPEIPAMPNPYMVMRLTPDHWTCDPINAAYFERFVALAEAHQIPIFWLIPPLTPEVESRRIALGTAESYTQFAREAQTRHPSLVVLDARRAGYDQMVHIDPVHLDSRGAAMLSLDVASTLDDQLKGRSPKRWHDLPQPSSSVAGSSSRSVY